MEAHDFERVHGVLLVSAGLPESLYSRLHAKLRGEVFDGGSFFAVEPAEDGQRRRLLLSAETLTKHSDVFLVDHAWSFRLTDARKQLENSPALADRMGALMCVVVESEVAEESASESNGDGGTGVGILGASRVLSEAKTRAQEKGEEVLWLELDDLDLSDTDLRSLNLSSNFPNLVGLSLWGNKLESLDSLLVVVRGLSSLRALWLNNTPIDMNLADAAMEAVVKDVPHLEIYNSRFTKKYTQWALGFCGGILGPENPLEKVSTAHALRQITDLDLSDRNLHSLSPKIFNATELPFLTILNIKGNLLEEDTTVASIQTLKTLVSLQSLQVDIPGPLGSSASDIVEGFPQLRSLNGVDAAVIIEQDRQIVDCNMKPRNPMWSPAEPLVDRVLRAMWQYLMCYRLADEEKLDETSIWYVMDELGSALRHSGAPNVRVAPFMYLPDGTLQNAISYSLLWPIQDIKRGEECTRDYLFGVGEANQRSAKLTAWFHTPKSYFIQAFKSHQSKLQKLASQRPSAMVGSPTRTCFPDDGRPLGVYSDIPFVLDFLKRPGFVFVEEPKQADIIWTSYQIDDEVMKATGIQSHQYVNQFPFEACLVMKHHLAETMQQAHGKPHWLQSTYDMERQLSVFIGDYFEREDRGHNNLWIVKPWNMARTIDTTVTSRLEALIRLVETGPKIVQKYIDPPALFQGRKFDLRYIILLRSLHPLEVYLFDVFWVRLSNNKYTTEESSLSEFETHFTVMNYMGRLNHTNTDDFVPAFEKEHCVDWKQIHERVKYTLRKVFEGAAIMHPEMHSARARAMYGVDIMLDSAFQPKLLEVTYCPDCERACKYDVKKVVGDGELFRGKDFVDCVFGNLFLNEKQNVQRL